MKKFINAFSRSDDPYINVVRKETSLWHRLNEYRRESDLILNIGSSNTTFGANCINLDIQKKPRVHLIGDAHYLPFSAETFDICILSAVLQYCSHPFLVAAEMYRVLKPGGTAFIDTPFFQPYCGPHDLYRFSIEGLAEIFGAFEFDRCGTSIPMGSALSLYLQNYLLLSIRNRYVRYLVTNAVSILLLLLSYGVRSTRAELAGAHLIVVRKPYAKQVVPQAERYTNREADGGDLRD